MEITTNKKSIESVPELVEGKEGYKKTKVGWIPKEWEFLEVENFLDRSKTKHNPKNSDLTFPCIELENIEKENGFINGYTSSADQLSIKNKFNTGEVLFGKLRPYLKKYWLAEFEGVCSSEIWVLKGKDKTALNEFVFYLIQQHRFIQASNVTSGSKMPRADWEFLSKFPFPLPPLPEQQKIAKILSTWDKAIEQSQNLIQQLKSRKKGLMQQLLTGKTRLKGFSGEWKEVQLGEHLQFYKKKSINSDLYPVYSSSKKGLIMQSDYYGGNNRITSRDIEGFNIIPPGYATYRSRSDDGIFTFNLNIHDKTGVVSKYYPVFTCVHSNKNFIIQTLNYHHNTVRRYAVGTSQLVLSEKDLKQLKFHLPSHEEQNGINEVLTTADSEIKTQENYLAQLQAQKKGLMQQLLTGQKRVTVN